MPTISSSQWQGNHFLVSTQAFFPKTLHKRRSEQGKAIRKHYKNDIGIPYNCTKAYHINLSQVIDTITTFTTDNMIADITPPDTSTQTPAATPSIEVLIEYFKPRIRIRKITEREALRIMDVSDGDIDKMKAYPFATLAEKESALANADKKERNKILRAGLAKTNLYKVAGNSIVVSCLYHIFKNLFLPHTIDSADRVPTLFD